jgi:hypothetical protein
MDAATRALVRERAGNRCEYCGLWQEQDLFATFHVDHITARQHGGGDDLNNLGLACFYCNLHKGTNLTSIDPETLSLVALFHPRRQRWSDHFARRGAFIEGITPIGRATVRLLNMNAPDRPELREGSLPSPQIT